MPRRRDDDLSFVEKADRPLKKTKKGRKKRDRVAAMGSMPLTRYRDKIRRKYEKYVGRLRELHKARAAHRVVFKCAPSGRISSGISKALIFVHEYRVRLRELDAAVVDARGIDMMEREIYRSMVTLAWSSPEFGDAKNRYGGYPARYDRKERAKIVKRQNARRMKILEETGFDRDSLLAELCPEVRMSAREALVALGDVIRAWREEASLLRVEIENTKKRRFRLRKELRRITLDIEAVGGKL